MLGHFEAVRSVDFGRMTCVEPVVRELAFSRGSGTLGGCWWRFPVLEIKAAMAQTVRRRLGMLNIDKVGTFWFIMCCLSVNNRETKVNLRQYIAAADLTNIVFDCAGVVRLVDLSYNMGPPTNKRRLLVGLSS